MKLLCAAMLRTAAWIAPRERRGEWHREWTAELWYVSRQSPTTQTFAFCLGAYRDAFWLRRNVSTRSNRLQSAGECLSVLAAGALAAIAIFIYLVRSVDLHNGAVKDFRAPVLAYFFVIAVAALVVRVTTNFSLGEYPSAYRFRRWGFLAAKFLLVVPIVFCGTFDLAPVVNASAGKYFGPRMLWALQPQVAIILYVIAFRWAITDQRRRCPVCLRLLRPSASIGSFSHSFLDWYGIELFCSKGHGLLHVPEIATTYDTQRWTDLDPSWSVLFP